MPPAKVIGPEGAARTELFQWGDTSMADWRRTSYGTTYGAYGGGFSMERKPVERDRFRGTTPWSTSNNQYGKGVTPRVARSLDSGSVTGSYASVPSYRSHLAFNRKWNADPLSLTEERPHARKQLEEHLRQQKDDGISGGAAHLGLGPDWMLPPLDPSKYLVAQGPVSGWQEKLPSTGNSASQLPEAKKTANRPDISSLAASQSHPKPPKTGPAKKYLRDTLDRFLRSIPEDLRPKTRKQMPLREAPQILKVEHGPTGNAAVLPVRTKTDMSHAVPSRGSSANSSSSGFSSASDDGVVDLNDPVYDIQQELIRK